ncbi:Apple [Macrophomina phaseolina MS6]|uniref:Apple n=1 Tax=Macrophomina phaseolina (strain MS6) TaxID=1126212 RepID=K2S8A1_MACPH|nr:Apple [Macrophomina phaseolina MS6]
MGSSTTNSFEACIEDCASTTGCIDVSYVYGSCYKKNTLNDAVSLAHVWTAKLIPSDTDASSSTITSAATTAAAAATDTPIRCPASNGTTAGMSTGGTYEILCAIDYAGGDFKALDTPTFEECLQACDKNAGCVALSYVAPSCYLKSELLTPVSVSYVWGAVVKKAAKDIFEFPTVADKPLEPGAAESMMATVMTLESPPLATLGPVAPPGINMGGLKVLTPDLTAELWYNGGDDAMDDEDSGAVTVRLTIDYKYPSVVLDHSIYIKDVSCAGRSLQGRFSENTPFLHAAQEWPSQAPILLITGERSCGNGEQNSFWLASSVAFDMGAMTFSAPGESVELADIYENMDVDFGKIEQRNNTDNGTSPDDGTESCGSPSSSFLDHLPAVACGTNFDKALDDALGYYSANGASQQVVLAAAGVESEVTETGLQARTLQKRWSLWGAIKSVAKAVVNVVVTVARVVAAVVVQVVKKAAEVVVTVVKAVVATSIAVVTQVAKLAVFIATGNYSNSLTLPVNMGPPASVQEDSPWGSKGFKFYTYTPDKGGEKWRASEAALEKIQGELLGEADPEPGIELWCVDCGVRGKVVATGSISATPLSGLKKGSIGVSGNMYAGVFLGVNAFAQWEKTIRKDLFVKGLPGWSIPGIVSLGPQLVLGAQATFSVEAEGQLITGASLNWPSFHATLDFVDKSKSSQSGWSPQITKKFEAHGEVSAKAALGLPVTISFGINILNGVFEKSINLTDIPAITAEATLEVDIGTEKNQFGSDECAGIDWSIALTNELRLDISDTPGWTLNEWASPALASGCIGRSRGGGSGDESSSTTTSSEPTATPPPIEDLSLKCPAADGTTYTDANSNTYAVKCHSDAPNNDISTSVQSTFDDCINWCGTISGCVGVAYAPARRDANCWAKGAWANQRTDAGYQYETHTAQMNSPFIILSVVYADRDVTGWAASNIVRGNRLIIDTNNVWRWAGDPWGGNPKSIFMLYMYGAETRTFVSWDGQGTFVINPGPVSSAPNSEIVPSYGQMWGVYNLQVVGVAYGRNAITRFDVWANIYNSARFRGRWAFTNGNFAWDTWGGVVKSGVIWYKDVQTGAFYAMAARENQEAAFAQVRYNRRVRRDGETIDSPYGYGNGTVSASNSTLTNSTTTSAVTQPTPTSAHLTLPSDSNTADSDFPQLTTTNSTANSTHSGFVQLTSTNSSADATDSSDFPQLSNTNSTTNSTSGVFPQLSLTNSTTNSTSLNSTSTDDDSDFTLTPFRVVDTTNTLAINPGINGNLFLSIIGDSTDLSNFTSGSLAGDSESKTILGDISSRLLHYYPSVMASTGASRLRLAEWDDLPNGAKLITLAPVEAEGVSMLMAIDAAGNYFWPFFCGIKGQLNKVFLVKDPDAGAAALEKENMKFTVTGGDAYSCAPLALVVKDA